MKIFNYVLLVFFSFLLLVGCEESQWKKPTEVVFMVDINKEEVPDRNVYFTEGQIVIRDIAFDGKRVKGDDVYFEVDFDEGLVILFSSSINYSQLTFEIPQGRYNSIRIDFEAEETDVELIRIIGNYQNSDGEVFPIIFEVEEIEFYDKIAKNTQGNTEIDLVEGITTKAIILLNPVFWFSSISSNQLDNAETTVVNGIASILINSEINEDLYDIIDDKVGAGTEIIFD